MEVSIQGGTAKKTDENIGICGAYKDELGRSDGQSCSHTTCKTSNIKPEADISDWIREAQKPGLDQPESKYPRQFRFLKTIMAEDATKVVGMIFEGNHPTTWHNGPATRDDASASQQSLNL